MKELILSDFIRSRLEENAQRRNQEYEREYSEYRARREAWDKGSGARRIVNLAILSIGVVAGTVMVLANLLAIGLVIAGIAFLILLIRLGSGPKAPTIRSGDEDRILEAGQEGENIVANILGRYFNDDWTLVKGYRNPGGEIDQILVGSRGICAIEIKHINGTVSVNGDRWVRDRYDNYGNLVEQNVTIADRGGRSPSAQLNASASRLESFLNTRSGLDRVRTAVVLSHPKSDIDRISRPRVDNILTLASLEDDPESFFGNSSVYLNKNKVQHLTELIQRDHDYHENRRSGGNRRSGRNNRQSGSTDRRRASAMSVNTPINTERHPNHSAIRRRDTPLWLTATKFMVNTTLGKLLLIGILAPILMTLTYPILFQAAINDALPATMENPSYGDKVKHGFSQFHPKHYLPEAAVERLNPFDGPSEEEKQHQRALARQMEVRHERRMGKAQAEPPSNAPMPKDPHLWTWEPDDSLHLGGKFVLDESQLNATKFDESDIREVSVVTHPLNGLREDQDRAKQLGPPGPDGCHTLPQGDALYAELEITDVSAAGGNLIVTVKHPWMGTSERCHSKEIRLIHMAIPILNESPDLDEARAILADKGISIEDEDLIKVPPLTYATWMIQGYIDHCKSIPGCWLAVKTKGYAPNGRHVLGEIRTYQTQVPSAVMESLNEYLVGSGIAFSPMYPEHQAFAINNSKGYWPLINAGVIPPQF